MSKRAQLIFSLVALGLVATLLIVLFLAILGKEEPAEELTATETLNLDEVVEEEADPFAGREEQAQAMVLTRRSRATLPTEGEEEPAQRYTVEEIVETELLHLAFPNLWWDRIEVVGWRSFQQERGVYEVQFVLRDLGVEFGPAWLVQTERGGIQPPGSGGIVSANVFAEVVENGTTEDLERFLNRESDVVEALINHQFENGARLAAALLVFLKSERDSGRQRLAGWTVLPERIVPDEHTFYRAFFQWYEERTVRTAAWEINLDTHEFRGLNLLASDVMLSGDAIKAEELTPIRPASLDDLPDDVRRQHRVRAVLMLVQDDRLLEALQSLLWHRDSIPGVTVDHAVQILDDEQSPTTCTRDTTCTELREGAYEDAYCNLATDGAYLVLNGHPSTCYRERSTIWKSDRVEDVEGRVYSVSYFFREGGEEQHIVWHINPEAETIEPQDELARLVHIALRYVALPIPELPEEPVAEAGMGTGMGTGGGLGTGMGSGTGLGADGTGAATSAEGSTEGIGDDDTPGE